MKLKISTEERKRIDFQMELRAKGLGTFFTMLDDLDIFTLEKLASLEGAGIAAHSGAGAEESCRTF